MARADTTRARSGGRRPAGAVTPAPARVAEFRELVWRHYAEHGRHDLPWRQTSDPYVVLVSEVMLQQTQVPRVLPRYEAWMAEFPTLDSLAAAPLESVLRAWQGLGYHRRAVALKRAAEIVSERFGGELPRDTATLEQLPGVGPATAAGIMAFAYGEPALYLETNVRAVFLHEFFGDRDGVPDREIRPLVEATLDSDDPRGWYYALLDYGWWLKRTQPNPTRRSRHYAKQSAFEGSWRQKRARALRAVIAVPGVAADTVAAELAISPGEVSDLLAELESEGFLAHDGENWFVAP